MSMEERERCACAAVVLRGWVTAYVADQYPSPNSTYPDCRAQAAAHFVEFSAFFFASHYVPQFRVRPGLHFG